MRSRPMADDSAAPPGSERAFAGPTDGFDVTADALDGVAAAHRGHQAAKHGGNQQPVTQFHPYPSTSQWRLTSSGFLNDKCRSYRHAIAPAAGRVLRRPGVVRRQDGLRGRGRVVGWLDHMALGEESQP